MSIILHTLHHIKEGLGHACSTYGRQQKYRVSSQGLDFIGVVCYKMYYHYLKVNKFVHNNASIKKRYESYILFRL